MKIALLYKTDGPALAFALCAVIISATIISVPLSAHHSFAAEYDEKKPVTLTGVVTKVE